MWGSPIAFGPGWSILCGPLRSFVGFLCAPGQMARNAWLVLPLLKAKPLSAVVRRDGRRRPAPGPRSSIRLDTRKFDHLGPLIRVLCDKFFKGGGRTRKHTHAQFAESSLHSRTRQSSVHFVA